MVSASCCHGTTLENWLRQTQSICEAILNCTTYQVVETGHFLWRLGVEMGDGVGRGRLLGKGGRLETCRVLLHQLPTSTFLSGQLKVPEPLDLRHICPEATSRCTLSTHQGRRTIPILCRAAKQGGGFLSWPPHQEYLWLLLPGVPSSPSLRHGRWLLNDGCSLAVPWLATSR